MNTPVHHLFWDFDGTLYNSYPQVLHAFSETLKELSLSSCFNAEKSLALLKVSVYHAACAAAEQSGTDVQTIMDVFHRYHTMEHDFPPYDGLQKCLTMLKNRGFSHYLYTHRDQKAIHQLQQDGLWSLFSDAVTRDDGFPDKPAPDALLALMKRNHLTPTECAMVGDRDIDINAGHHAGMSGILFDPDGFYPDLQVRWKVASMSELLETMLHQ